jgi:hypothetical protein
MAACEGGDEEKGLVVASWGWAGAAFPFTFGRGDASSCVVLWNQTMKPYQVLSCPKPGKPCQSPT